VLGHPVFERGDWNINTVGVRSRKNDETGEECDDRFNDRVCVFYRVHGKWRFFTYAAATVPGRQYLVNPMLPEYGAAILVPGFYRGAYILGTHYGKPALQQAGTMRLYRDATRDTVFDMDPRTIREADWTGINIHYSADNAPIVGPWSAGCQVLRYGPESARYREFIGHYERAIEAGWGNKFSYGLVREEGIPPVPPLIKGGIWRDAIGVFKCLI